MDLQSDALPTELSDHIYPYIHTCITYKGTRQDVQDPAMTSQADILDYKVAKTIRLSTITLVYKKNTSVNGSC